MCPNLATDPMWGSSSIESLCYGPASAYQGTPARHNTSVLPGMCRVYRKGFLPLRIAEGGLQLLVGHLLYWLLICL